LEYPRCKTQIPFQRHFLKTISPECRWLAAGATATGRSHEAAGIPCQDAFASRRSGEATAVALADGAGSCPLSHFGAQAATKAAARYAARHFEELWTMPEPEAAEHLLRCALRSLQGLPAKHPGSTLTDFSSTLLLVVCSGSRSLAANLGDGVVAMRDSSGTWSALLPPERGQYANETFFLTGNNAFPHFRLAKVEQTGSAFILMTDGAADSLYERSTGRIAPAAESFVGWLQAHPPRTAQRALHNTLSTTLRSRTHDDCGVGVFARQINQQ
jgi:serine/threonine protein phosphatase PrpC